LGSLNLDSQLDLEFWIVFSVCLGDNWGLFFGLRWDLIFGVSSCYIIAYLDLFFFDFFTGYSASISYNSLRFS